jgi:hypothetical protein
VRRHPLLVRVQVGTRLRQQHHVVHSSSLGRKEQRSSAIPISKMNGRSLAQEVAEDLEVGGSGGEVLE